MGRRDRERSAPLTATAAAVDPLPPPAEPAPEPPAPEPPPAYQHAAHVTPPPTVARYRVRGPGLVCVRGRIVGAGKVLDLTPAEADSLAA